MNLTLIETGEVKPGLYKDLPAEEYARLDGANHSLLEKFQLTPAHARDYMLNGEKEQTRSLRFGWLAHIAILEPARFAEQFITGLKVGKRSNADKQAWEDYRKANAGKEIITDEELEFCQQIAEAVNNHQTAKELLAAPGFNEVSLVWDDPETGMRCKGRPDRILKYAGWSIIADLKTTQDASRKSFERSIHQFGYANQASYYLDGAQVVAPHSAGRKWIWIVVETQRPYLACVYEADDEALEYGRLNYRRHLRTYAECVKTNNWPGYSPGIELAGLPAWAYREITNEA